MTLQDKAVESFAKSFYEYHEALAPDFQCGSSSSPEWNRLSSNEQRRVIAAARLAFMELDADDHSTHGELFCDWSYAGTEGKECGC